MSQPTSLLSLEDALNCMRALPLGSPKTEQVTLTNAQMRVSAETVESKISMPLFDNSAVDGYAFCLADLSADMSLPVSQRIAAGDAPCELVRGGAARIFTGAPIPTGADCVVMQEHAILPDDKANIVQFSGDLSLQQNIRPAGQDFLKGAVLIERGQVLNPPRLGLLASAGVADVRVYRKLRVAIFSTGDELLEPGNSLKAGMIYNSNRYLLTSLLVSLNVEVVDLGCVKDDFSATCEVLLAAVTQADLILSTGGASVGEEDYVQRAIKANGSIEFWRIAIKPGKPFMQGEVQGCPILGLPGNPSAVLITFLQLAKPIIHQLQGCRAQAPKAFKLPIRFTQKRASIRREFIRVQRDEAGMLCVHPNQSSGMLSSACWAEGLAVLPENACVNEGDLVDFYPFSMLLAPPETPLVESL
jgi:molybdopterin molybdotransferase